MGKKFILEGTSISTDRPLNDIWKRIQYPHPFPSNLIMGNENKFESYQIGTGKKGGFRFDYGKNNWFIFRLIDVDDESKKIKWSLVDIKKSPIKKLEISIALSVVEFDIHANTKIKVEYSTKVTFLKAFFNYQLKKRLDNFKI